MLKVSATKLRAAMLAQGFTITALSAAAGISQSRITQLTKAGAGGQSNFATIFKLASALNVPADELIETKGE